MRNAHTSDTAGDFESQDATAEITVLFVDLVRFTSLTSVHGDQAAANAATSLYEITRNALDEHGRLVKACTSVNPRTGDNDRAHDLVDLQILEHEEPIDKTALAEIANRLFRARNAHTWPPVVVSHPSWPTIYAEAADGLDVLTDIDDAVAWTNNFITSLTTD